MENVWQLLCKVGIELPHDSRIALLDRCLRELKTVSQIHVSSYPLQCYSPKQKGGNKISGWMDKQIVVYPYRMIQTSFRGKTKKNCFNWSIVALQCCVSFGCRVKWISYLYTISPPSWASLPLTHLDHRRAPSWAPHAKHNIIKQLYPNFF